MAISSNTNTTLITEARLRELAEYRSAFAVSIFLPAIRSTREVDQSRIRLKNLLTEAERLAESRGVDKKRVADVLRPARERLDDFQFWQHQGDGLAYLLADDTYHEFRLPGRVEEFVFLGDRFVVRPLVPSTGRGTQFCILALSQNRVRLFDCIRASAREIDLHDIPQSLAEAVGYDFEDRSLQFHTGAAPQGGSNRAALFHGQGRASDHDDQEIQEFLREIDAGVARLLDDPERPVILACVDFLHPMFRDVAKHLKIAEHGVSGNPDQKKMEELHTEALEAAQPYLDAGEERLRMTIGERAGTNDVVNDLAILLPALQQGRVAGLLAACEEPVWGHFDEQPPAVKLHADRKAESDDLLDLAINFAITTGAEVYAVERNGLPSGAWPPVEALLRF